MLQQKWRHIRLRNIFQSSVVQFWWPCANCFLFLAVWVAPTVGAHLLITSVSLKYLKINIFLVAQNMRVEGQQLQETVMSISFIIFADKLLTDINHRVHHHDSWKVIRQISCQSLTGKPEYFTYSWTLVGWCDCWWHKDLNLTTDKSLLDSLGLLGIRTRTEKKVTMSNLASPLWSSAGASNRFRQVFKS